MSPPLHAWRSCASCSCVWAVANNWCCCWSNCSWRWCVDAGYNAPLFWLPGDSHSIRTELVLPGTYCDWGDVGIALAAMATPEPWLWCVDVEWRCGPGRFWCWWVGSERARVLLLLPLPCDDSAVGETKFTVRKWPKGSCDVYSITITWSFKISLYHDRGYKMQLSISVISFNYTILYK